MGVWSWDAPNLHETVSVRWEEGVPVALNGQRRDLVGMFKEASRVAGGHGIGIGTHVVENRFRRGKIAGHLRGARHGDVGEVVRVPAPVRPGPPRQGVLHTRFSGDQRSGLPGLLAGPGNDLRARCAGAHNPPGPRGTITVRLYKGDVYFEEAEDTLEAMPHSLYTDDSSMEAMGSYDHADAEGFVRVLGVSAKNVGTRQFRRLGR